jgi:hypothetical protein
LLLLLAWVSWNSCTHRIWYMSASVGELEQLTHASSNSKQA